MSLDARATRLLTYVLMSTPMVVTALFFWRYAATGDFYSTVAQLIAAMYVAATIEHIAPSSIQREWVDRVELIVLLAVSWAGLLACLRALVSKPEPWTAAAAGVGLIAAVFLVTSVLIRRVSRSDPKLVGLVVYFVCLVPLAVLIVPGPT